MTTEITWYNLKQGFWCVIVLHVLIYPWFSLTKGCPVVPEKNWVPHDSLCVWFEMFLNQVLYVSLDLKMKNDIGDIWNRNSQPASFLWHSTFWTLIYN